MTKLMDQLNAPQREAVTYGDGPLLVLAGAGSGKTRVLAYRMAYLIENGHAGQEEVTAVTFTNKAAREMKHRVEELVGGALRGGFVGTFHRWALEMLRRYPREAGLKPGFSILDSDEQRALVSRALKTAQYDVKVHPPRMVQSLISTSVNRCEEPEQLRSRLRPPLGDVAVDVWEAYRKLKLEAGSIDFDDMLVFAVRLLKQHETIRKAVQLRARYLLVDEFQDTNRLQMRLLELALSGDRNITAVGDEDQSIYRWRGAELDNILSFERFFPGAHSVALEENYRSSQPILSVAGALIAHNQQRRGKKLFTQRDGGEQVFLCISQDERAEARWVVDRFKAASSSAPYAEMAVLVRTNAQTRPFEEELTRAQMPYRVVAGLRFWQRAEVKDALAYLRLVVNPEDLLAFDRVVNVPARGIGAATLDVLRREAENAEITVPSAARKLPEALAPRARRALGDFFKLLATARDKREELAPGDFVGWLLENSGLLALYDGDAEEKVARRENLAQLAAAVAESASLGQSMEEFLDSVALLEETEHDESVDAISLMTLHAAKGLEFDLVVLAGLEDGLLPHSNSRDDDGVEEERRLAYVGMTRARQWLALTGARTRFLFGQRQQTRPSPFLEQIPSELLADVSTAAWGAESSIGMGGAGSVGLGSAGAHTRQHPRTPQKTVSRAQSKVSSTVVDGDGTGWRPGDRVHHRRFGNGVVLSCQGRGPQLKLVVYFDHAGRKTLVPTIAKLEKK
ncbi:MAG: UvrD-helicase domain-containing protein [bacterium]|nr:UvrD-helicase domain-containing protein [bacterium]